MLLGEIFLNCLPLTIHGRGLVDAVPYPLVTVCKRSKRSRLLMEKWSVAAAMLKFAD